MLLMNRCVHSSENRNLSFWKGIACIFIVLLHSQLPGVVGYSVDVLSRFAVPFFFLISGYYLMSEKQEGQIEKQERIKRKIKSNLIVFLWATLVYLVYQGINFCIVEGYSITEFIKEFFYPSGLVFMLLFNRITYASHLWFVASLLYAYFTIYVLIRLKINFEKRGFVILSVIALSAGIIVREICLLKPVSILSFTTADVSFFRNWILLALPLVILGNSLRTIKNNIIININNITLEIAIFLGCIVSFIEKWYSINYLGTHLDLYFGTILCTFALFIYTINNSKVCYSEYVANIGRDLSLYIYILHVLLIMILTNHYTGNFADLSDIQRYLVTCVVLIGTVFLAWCIDKVKESKRS